MNDLPDRQTQTTAPVRGRAASSNAPLTPEGAVAKFSRSKAERLAARADADIGRAAAKELARRDRGIGSRIAGDAAKPIGPGGKVRA